MQSWIETEIEFKHTCPDNIRRWINFTRSHHRYNNEKINKYFSEYVNLIEYGIMATRYGHVLLRQKI